MLIRYCRFLVRSEHTGRDEFPLHCDTCPAIRTFRDGPNTIVSVEALVEIFSLASPAKEQRTAGTGAGLGQILEKGTAQDAPLLLVVAATTAAGAGQDATAGPHPGSELPSATLLV